MTRHPAWRGVAVDGAASAADHAAFARVQAAAAGLRDVAAAVEYDGSPVLRVRGVFLAGVAKDSGTAPGTVVVGMDLEERAALIDDAPGANDLTPSHARHPVVLVRADRVSDQALRDLLATSCRLAVVKAPPPRRPRPRPE